MDIPTPYFTNHPYNFLPGITDLNNQYLSQNLSLNLYESKEISLLNLQDPYALQIEQELNL